MARSPSVTDKVMSMMPATDEIRGMIDDTQKEIDQDIGIINSMTPAERCDPSIITPSRRNRIARGAGVEVPVVNERVMSFVWIKERLDDPRYLADPLGTLLFNP
jgi:signal recognition particle subunit SRP54